MHKSRLGGLIIDCQTDDLEEAERFWSAALGLDTYRSAEPGDETYLPFKTRPGEPLLELQKVTHPSRVHLDIEADDVEAEAARLETLGARRLEKVRDWWVMEAPTGHRFCVIAAQREDFDEKANKWE